MGIHLVPPRESHTKHLEISVSYFFLQECFGFCIKYDTIKHIGVTDICAEATA